MAREPFFSVFAVKASLDDVLNFIENEGYETEEEGDTRTFRFADNEDEQDSIFPQTDSIVGIRIHTPYGREDELDDLKERFYGLARRMAENVPLEKVLAGQAGLGRMYHYFANADLFAEYLEKLLDEAVGAAVSRNTDMVEGYKVDEKLLRAYHNKVTRFTRRQILEVVMDLDDVEVGIGGEVVWDRTVSPRPGRAPIKALLEHLPETPPDPEDPEDHRADRPAFDDALAAYRRAYDRKTREE